jgi:SAM-dependent methyltransferase
MSPTPFTGAFDDPCVGAAYQARLDALAATGRSMHAEADLVGRFAPRSVLDAGCGTGRVAIELHRRGIEVVGVDLSESMLAEAREREPELTLIHDDLATFALDRTFDLVLTAGNVPIFCAPDDRVALVANCARHVVSGGHLIAGFTLDSGYTLAEFDAAATAAGLILSERSATWEGADFVPESSYAVSILTRA